MNFQFHPAQKQIVSDPHRFRVVRCGRRFGKTTLAVYEMIGKAVAKKNRNIAYFAPTYQQARDIAWELLRKIASPAATNINETRLELTLRTQDLGTSKITLRGWESVDTARGQKFDFLVPDEVASYKNFWANWQEILRPTLTDTKGEGLFIGTPKGFNHFYDLSNLQDKDKDFKSFHFTSYDNPFLPVEELDKARQEMTEDRFAQEYLADFRKTEGLVYKEFKREIHTTDKIPERINEVLLGVDFGYSNPAAILKIVKDYDGVFTVVEEWYKTQQTTEQIIEISKSFKPNVVYPDPAEPDRIAEMQKAGLNCREVSKDIEAAINKVRELIKQGRLKIHKNCTNLIWEFETYRYPDKKPELNSNELPVKDNDHALDALRYALYTHSPIPYSNPFNNKPNLFR